MYRFALSSVVFVLSALGFATFGCGSGDQASLGGTEWRLSAWSVSSLVPSDFAITAQFTDEQISGSAAVNNYSGPYSASSDGGFAVGSLAATMMAGPEPAMRAESTYLRLLEQAREYRMETTELTLLDANGNEILIFGSAK